MIVDNLTLISHLILFFCCLGQPGPLSTSLQRTSRWRRPTRARGRGRGSRPPWPRWTTRRRRRGTAGLSLSSVSRRSTLSALSSRRLSRWVDEFSFKIKLLFLVDFFVFFYFFGSFSYYFKLDLWNLFTLWPSFFSIFGYSFPNYRLVCFISLCVNFTL